MKIGIIGSHQGDMHITKYLDTSFCAYEDYLDTRFGSWENLATDDVLWRCQLILDSVSGCDCVILPPVCEMLYYEGKLQVSCKVVPLFAEYCKEIIMKNSIVGKTACFIPLQSQGIMVSYRKNLLHGYIPSQLQLSNKHFQTHFPLYFVDTQFRNVCFDLKKTRFVNKLVKTQCKKLKDYAVDSLMIASRSYMYILPTACKAFSKKIKCLNGAEFKNLLSGLLLS